MNPIDDTLVIRLLRYLHGEADSTEIAALDALLVEDSAACAALLDLAWQSQAQHELTAHEATERQRVPVRSIIAVAACLGFLFLVLRPDPSPPTPLASPSSRIDWNACFEREVSWTDLYHSVLLYPPSVWNQLFDEPPRIFPTFGEESAIFANGTLPTHAHTFDHIRVIPFSDSFTTLDSTAVPAL